MRAMAIITGLWLVCCVVAFLAGSAVVHLPLGEPWGSVAAGVLFLQFICWGLGILLLPVVVIGWPVALLTRRRRAPAQPAKPLLAADEGPGIYLRDTDGIYRKVS